MKPLHLAILIDCSLNYVTYEALRERNKSTVSLTRSAVKALTDSGYIEVHDIVGGVHVLTSTELGDKRLTEMLTQLDKWRKEVEQ